MCCKTFLNYLVCIFCLALPIEVMSEHQGLKHEHDLGNSQLTAEEKRELNGW